MDSPRRRILVVDDDRETLSYVEDLLGAHGYEVTGVIGVHDAMDCVARRNFDLVITDLKMPSANGMEFLNELRSRRPGIPVLFYTAYANPSAFSKALHSGAVDMIQKPATDTELIRAVQDALESPASAPPRGRILVVEDDLDTLMMLTQGLNGAGFAVECATNLGEAYRALERGGIRLVLMDIGLPGIDGFHGLFDIKHDPRFRDVPVILVTAYSEGFQEQKGMVLGADAYIRKPFRWEELLSAVRSHFRAEEPHG
jgi:DNA-binding response OmpR family regulator